MGNSTFITISNITNYTSYTLYIKPVRKAREVIIQRNTLCFQITRAKLKIQPRIVCEGYFSIFFIRIINLMLFIVAINGKSENNDAASGLLNRSPCGVPRISSRLFFQKLFQLHYFIPNRKTVCPGVRVIRSPGKGCNGCTTNSRTYYFYVSSQGSAQL